MPKQIDAKPRSFTIEVAPAPKWPLLIFVPLLLLGIWLAGPFDPKIWAVAFFGAAIGFNVLAAWPRQIQRDR